MSIFKECRNGMYPEDVCKDYLEMYAYDNIIVLYMYGVNPIETVYLCGSCAEDVKYMPVVVHYDSNNLLPTKTSTILNYMVSIIRQDNEDLCYYSVVRGYELNEGKICMTIDDNSNIPT